MDTIANGGMSPEKSYREGGPFKSISIFSMGICISMARYGFNIDFYPKNLTQASDLKFFYF